MAGAALVAMGGMGGGMAGMGGAPPVNLHTIVTRWDVAPFPFLVAAVCVLSVAWYVAAMGRVEGRGRHWPRSRLAFFVLGVISVELALGSSVAVLAGHSFSAHMVQHLLLMVAGPPLLALGAPMTLALQTSSRRTKVRLLKGLNSRPFKVLTHPVVVWFLYYFSMFAFFLSPALGFAMDHMPVMDLVNVGFFLGATLFWWPMVGLDPIPHWRMGYGMRFLNLLIGVPFESFLGIALLMAAKPVAPMYTVAGTHAGGGVLWAVSELATLVAMIPIFNQWYKADTRQAVREDARADLPVAAAGVPSVRSGWAATFAQMRRDAE